MSATDTSAHYFFEAKPRLAATVGGGGVASAIATTIPHSFVGLDEGDAYIVTINRTDATGSTKNPANETETFIGKVSGTNFINCIREVEGTAQAWAADTVLEILISATVWNKMVSGLEVAHEQTGLHKSGAVYAAPDFNGTEVVIDADADTSMTADTDDQIDWKLGGSDRFRMKNSGDFDIVGATGNVTIAGADPNRTITLTPGFLKPTTTSGCSAPTQVEAATNDIDYDVLDFDASSDERAYVNFQMPNSWDGGVVQFRYNWTNAGGGAAETVNFALKGRSYGDDEAIDQACGTAVAVSDTWTAQGDNQDSAWSGDVTLAGTPAAGEWVHLEIMRDVSEDTLTGDARLKSLQIRYKVSQFSD